MPTILDSDQDESGVEQLPPLDIRIPAWDSERLQQRHCPFCQSRSGVAKYRRPDTLQVKRCDTCNTLYVSPAPSSQALEEFYSSYHTDHFGVNGETPASVLTALRNADPLGDVRIQVLHSLMKLAGARVLDIGCGKAAFLFKLKLLGANIAGIEVDSAAASFARELGIDSIHNGSIATFDPSQRFDLIVLNDLIEHPFDPLDLLQRAVGLLRDGGLLLVWTPNGDRPAIDHQRITLRVDLEHLQYLGARTILHWTRTLPLEIVHYETLGYPSLGGITGTQAATLKKGRSLARHLVKQLPGFSPINRLRQRLYTREAAYNDRLGNYHLLCVLKKVGCNETTAPAGIGI